MANLGDAIKGLLMGAGEEYLGHLKEKRSRQAKEAEATRKRAQELIDQANKRAYETAKSQRDVLTGLYKKYADQLPPETLDAIGKSLTDYRSGVEIDPITGRVQPKSLPIPKLDFQPSAMDQSLIDYHRQQTEASQATEELRKQQELESQARVTREEKRANAYIKNLQDKTKKQPSSNAIRDLRGQDQILNDQEKTILARLPRLKDEYGDATKDPDESGAGPQTRRRLQNIRDQREGIALVLQNLNQKVLREKGIYTPDQKQRAAIFLSQKAPKGTPITPKNIEAVLRYRFDDVMSYVPRIKPPFFRR